MTSAPPLRLSIALCTSNSEKFLSEQLASLAAQTLKPDELAVCDDHSTDKTLSILEDFAGKAPFEVRVHVQPQKVGFRGNREESYRRCRGELIAVCDHDDVWDPQKLELTRQALDAHPECLLAFCDCRVVDQSLKDLGYTSWAINSLNESRLRKIEQRKSFEALIPNSPVADATMMFRSSLLETALPFPIEWMPDEWMSTFAAAIGGCAIVRKALISYRQHQTNIGGGKRVTLWEHYRRARRPAQWFIDQEKRFTILRDRLLLNRSPRVDELIPLVERRMQFAGVRARMRQHPLARPWLILRELARGNYHSMGTGFRTLAMDLAI